MLGVRFIRRMRCTYLFITLRNFVIGQYYLSGKHLIYLIYALVNDSSLSSRRPSSSFDSFMTRRLILNVHYVRKRPPVDRHTRRLSNGMEEYLPAATCADGNTKYYYK